MKQKVLILAILIMAITPGVFAYDFSAVAPSGQTLYYNIVDGNARVTFPGTDIYSTWTGFTKPTGNLIIPNNVYYGGHIYTVTSVNSNTFKNCSDITSVTIPSTITSIAYNSFSGCSGITSVNYNAIDCTISSNNTIISPFNNCPNLSIVNFGDSVNYIPPWLLYNCDAISSIVIPNNTISIGYGAFSDCSALTSVTIGNSVTTIMPTAFQNCSALTSLTIGSSVTTIYSNAFDGCSSLSSIFMRCYPPSILSNTFSGFPVNITITVPCGALTSYQNAQYWSNFTHFVEGCATISVTANDFTLGGVTGGGEYTSGDTVTLTAIPYFGSRFIGWSNGSQENPLTFVATTSQNFVAAFGV